MRTLRTLREVLIRIHSVYSVVELKWLHPVTSGAPRWKFGCQRSSWLSSHLPADFKVRKHTFKASGACNGREVLRGTPGGRHGISAIEAADCLGNREPTIHWQVSRTSAACREGPENTSRPALCGASPWGGFPEPKYRYSSQESHAPSHTVGKNGKTAIFFSSPVRRMFISPFIYGAEKYFLTFFNAW